MTLHVPEAGKAACGTKADQSGANQMPSEQYKERLTFFDKVFSNGVDQYVHPTGIVGVKLVVGVEASAIDPYRISPYGRAAQSGYVSVFLADREETAKAEVFQGRPPLQYGPKKKKGYRPGRKSQTRRYKPGRGPKSEIPGA